MYFKELADISSLALPKTKEGNYHVWHLFVIRVQNREKILKDFSKHKVEFGIHYPVPIHRQKAYSTHKKFNKNFKLADSYADQLLSLPIFPKMEKSEVKRVVSTIKNYI